MGQEKTWVLSGTRAWPLASCVPYQNFSVLWVHRLKRLRRGQLLLNRIEDMNVVRCSNFAY